MIVANAGSADVAVAAWNTAAISIFPEYGQMNVFPLYWKMVSLVANVNRSFSVTIEKERKRVVEMRKGASVSFLLVIDTMFR